jgi:FkbM family methyltransferase
MIQRFFIRVKRFLRRLGPSGKSVQLSAEEEERIRQKVSWPWMAERHLGLLLRELEVDCVLDVGANHGGFAEMIRRAGWSGPLISFEPQSSCCKVLKRLAAGDPAWSIHPIALSDHEGTVRLTLRASSTFTSLNEPRFDSKIVAEKEMKEKLDVLGFEDVPVRRLDAVLDELPGKRPERIFLKIDTQGHDEAVLAGASGIVDRVIGLQVELTQDPLYHSTSHYLDVLQAFRRCGFDLSATFPVFRDPESQATLEFDGVLVRNTASPNKLTRADFETIWSPAHR